MLTPQKWLKSEFGGSKSHFIVTFEPLDKRGKKSLSSLVCVNFFVFSCWGCSWASSPQPQRHQHRDRRFPTVGPQFHIVARSFWQVLQGLPEARMCLHANFGEQAHNAIVARTSLTFTRVPAKPPEQLLQFRSHLGTLVLKTGDFSKKIGRFSKTRKRIY